MTEDKKETITRREFLKLGAAALGSLAFNRLSNIPSPETPIGEPDKKQPDKTTFPEIKDVFLKSRSITAQKAAEYAQSQFVNQPYKFGIRDCAIFVGRYASYYGVSLFRDTQSPSTYKPIVENGLPDATTVKQASWFREAAKSIDRPELVKDIPTKLLADGDFWQRINPGSLIYIKTKGASQHGYDQYSHTGIFLGISDEKPLFAEYSPEMAKGPQIKRELRQFLGMYFGQLPDLDATIVNLPEIAALIWSEKKGPVVPNSETLIKNDYNLFLTVNVNNGLTTLWEIENGKPIQREFSNNKLQLFSVTGRELLPRTELTKRYDDALRQNPAFKEYTFSSYAIPAEKKAAFYGTPLSVPRFYLTPPLVFELDDFGWVGDFGNLGGATDIAFLHNLYLTNSGTLDKIPEFSDYTIHATPQRTKSQQDLLLRDVILNKANQEGVPPDKKVVHLTSGCVNFTPEVFEIIKKTLKAEENKKTAVVFSYPDFPQDRQLNHRGFSLRKDPLGGLSRTWGYTEL